MARILLVVAGEAALLDQPAEAALDDPAAWQHHEALLVFELLDDAQGKARGVAEELPHVLHEGFEFSGVATVGEDDEQAQQAVAQQAQEQLRAVTILHAGGRDHHAQEQAARVGDRVALAPLDLFARVVATAQRR